MATPPALTELADAYPNPSNEVFKSGITKFFNYATGLLGATGDAAQARTSLGVPALAAAATITGSWRFDSNLVFSPNRLIALDSPSVARQLRLYQTNEAGDLSVTGIDRWNGTNRTAHISMQDGLMRVGSDSGTMVLQVPGASSGLKFTGISGSSGGNTIAVGWTGSALAFRVDSVTVGNVTPSDARLKLGSQSIGYGLQEVLALRPVWFEYDQSKSPIGFPEGRRLGFVAGEVEEVIPEIVSEWAMDAENVEGTTYKQLDEKMLIPVLTKAIQDQQALIDALKARVEALGG